MADRESGGEGAPPGLIPGQPESPVPPSGGTEGAAPPAVTPFPLLQSNPVATLVSDPRAGGLILDVNEAFERFTGYRRADLIGQTAEALRLWADIGQREEALRRLEQDGRLKDFEFSYRHASGEIRTALLFAEPMTLGDRRVMVSATMDITEHKWLEAALRDSEARLRAVIEDQTEFIVRWRPDGTRTFVNEAYARYFGQSRESLIGTSFFPLIETESERQMVAGKVAQLTPQNPAMTNVHRARRGDGEQRWQEWTDRGVFDSAGRLVEVQSVGRDVHERAVAEEQRRAAERRLQHVVTSSPAVLFTLDVEHGQIQRVGWISQNVEQLLGFTVEEARVAGWLREQVHPEDLSAVVGYAQTEVVSSDFFSAEYRFRHRNGQYRWITTETRLLRDESGQPIEVVGSLTDVTERKRLEDQFRQAQKMEAIGHLAGGLAHDFNNLLTIISGYSEILLPDLPGGDPRREMVEEIRAAGARAAGLTRQLLAFSRQTVLEPTVLDVNEVVREHERMLRRLIGEDVQLDVVLSGSLQSVKVDRGQIGQVIMNLAVNARDAMPTGGKLLIETSNVTVSAPSARAADTKPGRYVLLTVSDTGIGMTPEVQAHIFEPFFTTKEPGKGTGLGLPTVYGIVKQSGGFVTVVSESGAGTAFRIHLPVADGQAAVRPPKPEVLPMTRGHETILLVEDEDGVRSMVGRVLKRAGYVVLEASRARDSLKIVHERADPIHLVITDVVMPEMGGRELVEELARVRPGIKVLYLSGYTADAVVRHGVMQAEVAFLQKPFTMAALTNKVREVLDAQS